MYIYIYIFKKLPLPQLKKTPYGNPRQQDDVVFGAFFF